MSRIRLLFACLLTVVLTMACGYKGPLYLPGETPPETGVEAPVEDDTEAPVDTTGEAEEENLRKF